MVAGQAKSRFDDYRAYISIPSVVCGKCHFVKGQKDVPWVVIGTDCEHGKFLLAISLQEKGE